MSGLKLSGRGKRGPVDFYLKFGCVYLLCTVVGPFNASFFFDVFSYQTVTE